MQQSFSRNKRRDLRRMGGPATFRASTIVMKDAYLLCTTKPQAPIWFCSLKLPAAFNDDAEPAW